MVALKVGGRGLSADLQKDVDELLHVLLCVAIGQVVSAAEVCGLVQAAGVMEVLRQVQVPQAPQRGVVLLLVHELVVRVHEVVAGQRSDARRIVSLRRKVHSGTFVRRAGRLQAVPQRARDIYSQTTAGITPPCGLIRT